MTTTIQRASLKKNFSIALAGLTAFALAGCSATQRITNLEAVAEGKSYQAEYRDQTSGRSSKISPASFSMNQQKCSKAAPVSDDVQFFPPEVLSPGDLVEVTVGNDETFSGKYEISSDGTLKVRDLVSVKAYGRSVTEIGNAVSKALAAAGYYNVAPNVSVRLVDFGAVRAFIGGAVFEPGMITIGGSSATGNDNSRVQILGATTEGRRLSQALQNAGGVRPDADLSRVTIKRNGKRMVVDLRKAITGGMFDDKIILAGDEVSVPSLGCFQSALVTPSAVSPAGAKVFMSNLTDPAQSNANSAINKDTRELRYGTRMLQAVVSMNCVGGSKLTNASRSAVLYTRNPETGKSIVIERNIEDLLRNADRDDYDPFILPNDALACYDSTTTDVIKVAQGFGIVAGAVVLGRGF
jgi:polysaccharide export outer membrane protein